MLCMPSKEARSNSRMLMRNYFLRGAVEMALGHELWRHKKMLLRLVLLMAVLDPHRSLAVVVCCRDQIRKQRKTMKSWIHLVGYLSLCKNYPASHCPEEIPNSNYPDNLFNNTTNKSARIGTLAQTYSGNCCRSHLELRSSQIFLWNRMVGYIRKCSIRNLKCSSSIPKSERQNQWRSQKRVKRLIL